MDEKLLKNTNIKTDLLVVKTCHFALPLRRFGGAYVTFV